MKEKMMSETTTSRTHQESVASYVSEPKVTANLAAFQEFVLETSGAQFKTAKERDAAKHWLYVGIKSYSHYQAVKNADKRNARLAATQPVKAIRSPRARKTA